MFDVGKIFTRQRLLILETPSPAELPARRRPRTQDFSGQ